MVPTLKEVNIQNKIRLKVEKINGPKTTLNPITCFTNISYPFNCDKSIPYHLTQRTRGNIRAKQEWLFEGTTKYLPFLPKV